jgi:peroxiredoxin
MQQIVDLQNSPEFQALDTALLSVAFDPAEQQAPAAAELGLTTPMLVDADQQISESYAVLQWAVGTGEPGHTFVLVDESGNIAWIRDYGAPENGGVMYVPVDELVQQIETNLSD